jgi:hypothetical protein
LISLKQVWTICAWLFLLTVLFSGGPWLSAETVVSKEYQVKAVFLFNFAQFVTWPSTAFTQPDEPFRIGVLGDDPFDDFLDETVRGEKVDGHSLLIQRYGSVADVKNCRILFVSRSENGKMESILAGLKDKSILTVGDTEDFIRKGGIIRFITEANKIRLRINLEAAKSANLTISSQVLRLAEIVGPGKD